MDSRNTEVGSANHARGGNLPVGRGDRLGRERYVVQSELGWGSFSAVWLAWDTQTEKYVALKIIKSGPSLKEMANHEIEILKAIAQADPEDKQCVVKLLDDFIHFGPQGNHVCLVLELLGDNLMSLLNHCSGKGIPLHMVKEICFHVLRGLDFLHRKLSIIHSDIKPSNILLPSAIDPEKDPRFGVPFILPSDTQKSTIVTSSSSSSNIRKAANKELTGNQQIGLKQKGKLVAQDCGNAANDELEKSRVETQAVQTQTPRSFKSLFDDLGGKPLNKNRELRNNSPSEKQKLMASLDLKCKIADLGNACYITKRSSRHIQTIPYKCPETLLQSPYSTPADMWSVACIAFELATGAFLFDPHGKNTQDRIKNHLKLMTELLGVMPKTIALGGRLSTDFFDKNGNLEGCMKLQSRPLTNLLRHKFGFEKKDADDFSDFLVRLLDFVPKNRPTAIEAIHHPWLNGAPRLLQPSSPSYAKTQESDEVTHEKIPTV